jgi:hypothetical protein
MPHQINDYYCINFYTNCCNLNHAWWLPAVRCQLGATLATYLAWISWCELPTISREKDPKWHATIMEKT